ncbi:MAG: hypothetical protein M3O50_00975 [Myxococcota bacterium]|nr:hypothetical protein [Myxococcota bacterium]
MLPSAVDDPSPAAGVNVSGTEGASLAAASCAGLDAPSIDVPASTETAGLDAELHALAPITNRRRKGDRCFVDQAL